MPDLNDQVSDCSFVTGIHYYQIIPYNKPRLVYGCRSYATLNVVNIQIGAGLVEEQVRD